MAASTVIQPQTPEQVGTRAGWCRDRPSSCSGAGCRQEPDRVVDVRLGLCPCTWPQLPAVCSDLRQDGLVSFKIRKYCYRPGNLGKALKMKVLTEPFAFGMFEVEAFYMSLIICGGHACP